MPFGGSDDWILKHASSEVCAHWPKEVVATAVITSATLQISNDGENDRQRGMQDPLREITLQVIAVTLQRTTYRERQ